MTEAPHYCTVGPSAVTGRRCGKPAVYTFRATTGEIFAECADHYPGHEAAYTVPTAKIGDRVDVHRHGGVYRGTVVRVTRTGRVFAEVTYNNGATRVVEVD